MRSFFLILAHPIHHHSTSLLQFITKFLERGIQSCQTYSLHIHSFFLPLQSELHSHWSTSTSLRGHQGLPSYQACWSISSSYSQWRLLKYLRILTTLYFLKSPFLCLSLLSLKNFFNWRIIALQCCTGFCCTTTWISSICTFISSLLSLLPTHSPHPSLWVITEPRAELSVLYSNFPLANFHMVMYVCQWYSFNLFPSLFPLLCPPIYSLCLRLYSCPANRVISTIFLDSICMC